MKYPKEDVTEKRFGAAIAVHNIGVQDFDPIHEAQLLTYMWITASKVGLLINFNERTLIDGVKRFVP